MFRFFVYLNVSNFCFFQKYFSHFMIFVLGFSFRKIIFNIFPFSIKIMSCACVCPNRALWRPWNRGRISTKNTLRERERTKFATEDGKKVEMSGGLPPSRPPTRKIELRAFHGQPFISLWMTWVESIPQGEGGEQGDPLMPLLFCLGQHSALSAVVAGLQEGERLFAYLDDLYVVCKPDRAGAVHDLLRVHLWDNCRISFHAGKTKVWNRSGTYPPNCARLQRAATEWRGDAHLHPDQQGLGVAYVKRSLRRRLRTRVVGSRPGSSCLFCAAARSNFFLRTVNPSETDDFAAAHERCLCKILSILPSCGAEPGCHSGKEALDSGRTRTQPAVHWASWP